MFWKKKKSDQQQEIVESSSSKKPSPPPTFALPHGAKADHSPTIVNRTDYPIVVFLERGTLYNTQVLHPGEAVCMTRRETGGAGLLPYRVHALIGDEMSLPKQSDSVKNLLISTAIPAAFVAGCLATAMSAGTLAGPSLALAPMVSGMVVKGVVIDTAALAAGSVMASRATIVTKLLLQKKKENFMVVSKRFLPGQRYLTVTGGLDQGPLAIAEMDKRRARGMLVVAVKPPMSILDGMKEQKDDGDKPPPMLQQSTTEQLEMPPTPSAPVEPMEEIASSSEIQHQLYLEHQSPAATVDPTSETKLEKMDATEKKEPKAEPSSWGWFKSQKPNTVAAATTPVETKAAKDDLLISATVL